MKALLLVIFTLCLSSVAWAETSETHSTSEEKKTNVDAQSGSVQQQHNKQEAQTEHGADATGAHVKQQKSNEVTTSDNYGNRSQLKQQDKNSAEVKAEPDGDVSVEQKSEHSHQQTTK
jgi:hypothetical protein